MDTDQHRRRWPNILTDIGLVTACTCRQQYALLDAQPSKHEALNQCWFDTWPDGGRLGRRWAKIGPALGQRLVFAGSVDRPHCVSHISGCEDIKTVAQLIEPKDDLVTVDIKTGSFTLKYTGAIY